MTIDASDPLAVLNARAAIEARNDPAYPLLAVMVSGGLLAAAFGMIYALLTYGTEASLAPVVGGALVVVPCLWMLPQGIPRYVGFRRRRAARRLVASAALRPGAALGPARSAATPISTRRLSTPR